jgi:predicted DCC family thiol-disulfide oxidoreductase YuxK
MSTVHLSTFRVLLGVYLLQHFLLLVPFAAELFSGVGLFPEAKALPSFGVFPNPLFLFDAPAFAVLFLLLLCLLSVLLTFGWRRRICALCIWFGWAALLSRAPFIANPSIPFIGLLLLGLAALPGDLSTPAARSSAALLWKGVWVILALSYTVSGLHKLGSPSWLDGSALSELTRNPLARDYFVTTLFSQAPWWITAVCTWGALGLEILFAPLALFRLTRPWVWLAMVGLHLGILSMVSFADLTLGMLLVHLFTFDEGWIASRVKAAARAPIVFFDGSCVMCSRLARYMTAIDSTALFRLAPLQGETFRSIVPAETAVAIPDSIVVQTHTGALLTRSDAIVYIGRALGGILGLCGLALSFVPRFARDYGYDLVAKLRYRLFGRTKESCSLIPLKERTRFLP